MLALQVFQGVPAAASRLSILGPAQSPANQWQTCTQSKAIDGVVSLYACTARRIETHPRPTAVHVRYTRYIALHPLHKLRQTGTD